MTSMLTEHGTNYFIDLFLIIITKHDEFRYISPIFRHMFKEYNSNIGTDIENELKSIIDYHSYDYNINDDDNTGIVDYSIYEEFSNDPLDKPKIVSPIKRNNNNFKNNKLNNKLKRKLFDGTDTTTVTSPSKLLVDNSELSKSSIKKLKLDENKSISVLIQSDFEKNTEENSGSLNDPRLKTPSKSSNNNETTLTQRKSPRLIEKAKSHKPQLSPIHEVNEEGNESDSDAAADNDSDYIDNNNKTKTNKRQKMSYDWTKESYTSEHGKNRCRNIIRQIIARFLDELYKYKFLYDEIILDTDNNNNKEIRIEHKCVFYCVTRNRYTNQIVQTISEGITKDTKYNKKLQNILAKELIDRMDVFFPLYDKRKLNSNDGLSIIDNTDNNNYNLSSLWQKFKHTFISSTKDEKDEFIKQQNLCSSLKVMFEPYFIVDSKDKNVGSKSDPTLISANQPVLSSNTELQSVISNSNMETDSKLVQKNVGSKFDPRLKQTVGPSNTTNLANKRVRSTSNIAKDLKLNEENRGSLTDPKFKDNQLVVLEPVKPSAFERFNNSFPYNAILIPPDHPIAICGDAEQCIKEKRYVLDNFIHYFLVDAYKEFGQDKDKELVSKTVNIVDNVKLLYDFQTHEFNKELVDVKDNQFIFKNIQSAKINILPACNGVHWFSYIIYRDPNQIIKIKENLIKTKINKDKLNISIASLDSYNSKDNYAQDRNNIQFLQTLWIKLDNLEDIYKDYINWDIQMFKFNTQSSQRSGWSCSLYQIHYASNILSNIPSNLNQEPLLPNNNLIQYLNSINFNINENLLINKWENKLSNLLNNLLSLKENEQYEKVYPVWKYRLREVFIQREELAKYYFEQDAKKRTSTDLKSKTKPSIIIDNSNLKKSMMESDSKPVIVISFIFTLFCIEKIVESIRFKTAYIKNKSSNELSSKKLKGIERCFIEYLYGLAENINQLYKLQKLLSKLFNDKIIKLRIVICVDLQSIKELDELYNNWNNPDKDLSFSYENIYNQLITKIKADNFEIISHDYCDQFDEYYNNLNINKDNKYSYLISRKSRNNLYDRTLHRYWEALGDTDTFKISDYIFIRDCDNIMLVDEENNNKRKYYYDTYHIIEWIKLTINYYDQHTNPKDYGNIIKTNLIYNPLYTSIFREADENREGCYSWPLLGGSIGFRPVWFRECLKIFNLETIIKTWLTDELSGKNFDDNDINDIHTAPLDYFVDQRFLEDVIYNELIIKRQLGKFLYTVPVHIEGYNTPKTLTSSHPCYKKPLFDNLHCYSRFQIKDDMNKSLQLKQTKQAKFLRAY